MPIEVPEILLKKPVARGSPTSVTLLTVTPWPSNFCIKPSAVDSGVICNCAFAPDSDNIPRQHSKNILVIGFTIAKDRIKTGIG
jgi:hypothetical protein